MRTTQGQASLELLAAAAVGDANAVEHWLSLGADPDAARPGRVSALHLAAESGSTGAVEELLARGANAYARTDGGWTPLHGAAAAGCLGAVCALLRCGADPRARDARGEMPIHAAARWQRWDAVEVLAGAERQDSLLSGTAHSILTAAGLAGAPDAFAAPGRS